MTRLAFNILLFFADNHKKKLSKNRSQPLLENETLGKESEGLDDAENDNLGGKLSRLSTLTLSSLNSTFQMNRRRSEYATKKKYHSVDSESPTHQYDNIPFTFPGQDAGQHENTTGDRAKADEEEEESSSEASSGSSTSLTSPSSVSDSKRLSPPTQVLN